MFYKEIFSSNNVETTANAKSKEESTMSNKNNNVNANVEQNIIGGINMERVFNEELAGIIAEVVGHEKKMEEEVEMKKVSILDRFAAHHNRTDKEEVVVEELEEEKEMGLSEKKKAIIAKMKEENEAERKKFDVMFEAKRKAAVAEITGRRLVGKVKQFVEDKVEDFLVSNEESPAPVEKEVKEEMEEEVEEDNRTVQELIDSIADEPNVFIRPGAFDAALEEEKEEQEKRELVAKITEEMRKNEERVAEINEELNALQSTREEAVSNRKTIESEVAAIRAQIEFLESQRVAEDSGVEDDMILRTKDDIDAYFMGQ